jgi:hypothetical protein
LAKYWFRGFRDDDSVELGACSAKWIVPATGSVMYNVVILLFQRAPSGAQAVEFVTKRHEIDGCPARHLIERRLLSRRPCWPPTYIYILNAVIEL